MLSTNIIPLKQNLNKLLGTTHPNKGPVYEAAYNAYYSITDFKIDSVEDSEINAILDKTRNECERKRKEDADKFATEFCNALLEGGFMSSIADEIDKHIRQAMITINVPVLPPTLVSPTGPVTGSLIISEATGAQISIT